MKLETTKTFIKNAKAVKSGFRYIINQGSTRSSKSFSAMQVNVLRRIINPGTRSIVAGITLDIVKSTSLRDVKKILGSNYTKIGTFYKSEMSYLFNNGSEIKFISAEKPEKFHGVDSDDVFLEEPNIWKEPDELIKQLSMRCNGFIMLTLNPSRKLKWLDNLQKREDTILIHSTYKDNQFLSKRIINEIETRSKTDEIYKSIYKDGIYVANTELSVFKNWHMVDEMPAKEKCKWIVYGLDFGWSNDQTALVELRFYDSNLYVKEHLYELEMTTAALYEKLKDIKEPIVCDNSEPRLVTELKMKGIKNLRKTRKPKGSKLTNVKQLQNLTIFVESKSLNFKTEIELYQYKKVNGEMTSILREKEDHALDATFYAWRSKVKT